jgi:hypothetical protein
MAKLLRLKNYEGNEWNYRMIDFVQLSVWTWEAVKYKSIGQYQNNKYSYSTLMKKIYIFH